MCQTLRGSFSPATYTKTKELIYFYGNTIIISPVEGSSLIIST